MKYVHIIKCANVRALFAENKVRFARAGQQCIVYPLYLTDVKKRAKMNKTPKTLKTVILGDHCLKLRKTLCTRDITMAFFE